MTLNLTSAVKVREPGFSASECLELAKRLERAGIARCFGQIDCDRWDCDGRIQAEDEFSPRELATIVAALRAYAT